MSSNRVRLGRFVVVCMMLVGCSGTTRGQESSGKAAQTGQFFTVDQPLTSESVDRLEAAATAVLKDAEREGIPPVLLFELKSGSSDFGPSYELAAFLAHKVTGARKTVAIVPGPLSGYGALVALACDEIVMAPDATLGPIGSSEGPMNRGLRELVRDLARSKGRSEGLAVGMFDPEADLRRVHKADGTVDYVLASELTTYKEFHQVSRDEDAWEAGGRGVLSAERARAEGFANRLAENRAEIAAAYGVAGTSDNPALLTGQSRAYWIKLDRPLDRRMDSFLRRQLALAAQGGAKLLVLEFDVGAGEPGAADGMAEQISKLEKMRTVAYVNQAQGPAVLIALACDEIVFRKGGRLGPATGLIGPRPDVRRTAVLADRAAMLGKANGYPEAVARAMFDPGVAIVEALDKEAGAVVLASEKEVLARPDRLQKQAELKGPGEALAVSEDQAERFGLARGAVEGDDEFKSRFGLSDRSIVRSRATWVDTLVTTLNTPWMSGFLLFLGIFMLVLEMKMPGIGLPAITAALAFLLFFWSRYLGGTADSLEIILFLVGLVCLALELFVFPGFGVFGMSGVVLVLGSVVMASHTFVWPSDPYEYRLMGRTLLQVIMALLGVLVGGMVVGRYFPSMPLFNRLVLKAMPYGEVDSDNDPFAKPGLEGEISYAYLLGESGRTTTVLRPTGKARFGERLVEVTADGFFIERDSFVEVVEVQGSRVVVRKVSI